MAAVTECRLTEVQQTVIWALAHDRDRVMAELARLNATMAALAAEWGRAAGIEADEFNFSQRGDAIWVAGEPRAAPLPDQIPE